ATAATPAPAPRRNGDGEGQFPGSPLDARYTFESFCDGAANRVAFAAAQAVAEGGSLNRYNPLYIHAGVGRGKTHLLHATTRAARRADPSRKVVYLTAEYFMFRMVAAIRNQSAIQLKETLRDIDLLLIDDMQFLQGKSVQQEFCHMLNALIDGARQVVVAADRPPAELETLDERVRSRLKGGVAFEIGAPDLELRRRIIATRYRTAQEQHPGLDVPEPVLEYVAQSVVSNGRDLEGALNRLVAQWQFTGQTVTLASAEITLRDLVGAREPRRVRIEDIQRVVARHFNVSKADLLSSRRTRTIVRPRQIAMYLAKVLTPRSLPEIGRRFGGRDHTTVLHAVRKIEELIEGDKSLADEIELLKRMIDE
ncbi:MAG TPA: chromosomal replication initiator protein DnaA, partial [Bauldia sp.]|nr:chromosomal replication initiator protein DnaA [Bauldia sp.]